MPVQNIFGLDDWILDKSNKQRWADIAIDLQWMDIEPLKKFTPKQRLLKKDADMRAKTKALLASKLLEDCKVNKQSRGRLEVSVPYERIRKISLLPDIWHVWIYNITGAKKIKVKTVPRYFCVKMTVVIEIEGMKKGWQTVEDRMVLIKARSFEDAYSKIEARKHEYESPYLNSDGAMVRWRIESLDDCYETYIGSPDAINDKEGVEVYSRLRYRKLKKEYIWDGSEDPLS